MSTKSTTERAATWLARGLEELMATLGAVDRKVPGQPDFDVVIVGSGYGGAVAAAGLAGCRRSDAPPVRVCVLERGKEYLPGAFPASMAELPGHVRYGFPESEPQGKRDGLFDLRIGPDLNAVLANGLGGGSLVNAGVMVRPDPAVLARLPGDGDALQRGFDKVEAALGARDAAGVNTILRHASRKVPLKFSAHERLATNLGLGDTFAPAPLSIAMRDHHNGANVRVRACRLCGDCATGCNHEAKNSLDTNLLASAQAQGAQLYTGATVIRLERQAGMWCLHLAHTDGRLRAAQPRPFMLYAETVVLAAGALGSTEILLRSRSESLQLSGMLGQRVSGNGDMIAVRYDEGADVDAVGNENDPPDRSIGPTITAMFRLPAAPGQVRSLVQELAVPGPLRWLLEQMAATGRTLHGLSIRDHAHHGAHDPVADPCAPDQAALRRSSIVAVMNDDGAAGSLELRPGTDDDHADGAVRIRWPALRDAAVFADAAAALRSARGAQDAQVMLLTDPAWRLLPEEMEFLLQAKRGPLTTVHPLGGCPMGEAPDTGVVDCHGQVFRAARGADGSAVHPGLFVLDGAIVPHALGANPALTIAALAQRAVDWLRAQRGWTRADVQVPERERPRFRSVAASPAASPAQVELIERMSGKIDLRDRHGNLRHCVAELTLRCAPTALAFPGAAAPPDGDAPADPMRRRLSFDPPLGEGTLRLYDRADWNTWEELGRVEPTRPAPLVAAVISGHLDYMQREPSSPRRRILRAGAAWLFNRGARELWQLAAQRLAERGRLTGGTDDKLAGPGARRRIAVMAALLSHAGEVRRFDYALRVDRLTACCADFEPGQFEGRPITGAKRITYACRANPWLQLTSLGVDCFPASARSGAMFKLDLGFLVRENAALMRILAQPNAVAGLADLAALGMYFLRVLLSVHVLSFRKPDRQKPRTPQRLPGPLAGLPLPQISELEVARTREGDPVHVRLTRYMHRSPRPGAMPVMTVHGFGAGGTTFAHPAMPTCLAAELWKAGRDVWVLDLRTSAGMPAARQPWSFDEIAFTDIPAAVDHICRATGSGQVDIIAHCVGAAMLSMAVLSQPAPGTPFHAGRELLPGRIRRLVLSQMGPVMLFSQANILRGYLMAYLRHFAPMERYAFRIDGEPRLLDELLDRALSTLPYPPGESGRESPFLPWARAEFTGPRHRMDALYGRLFSLRNMPAQVLDNIDDFFGPVDLESMAQTIHFARLQGITTRAGRNAYVSLPLLRERWRFPTLALHSAENGVTDPATLHLAHARLTRAGCPVVIEPLPGYGHQDCWIGARAEKVCMKVIAFLDGMPVPAPAPMHAPARLLALPPWIGPVQGIRKTWLGPGEDRLVVGAATDPALDEAFLAVFVPVSLRQDRFEAAGGALQPLQGMCLYAAAQDANGWMRFEAPLPPPSATGMLMLVLYDEEGVFAADPAAASLKDPALAAVDLSQLDAGQTGATIQPAVRRLLDRATPAIRAAVRTALETLDRAQLELGLLTVREAAPPVDGLCLAVGSCQYPAGLLDAQPAFASYRRLAGEPGPELLLLLGDQIYADATGGLFDPADRDDRYVRPYEALLANPHVRAALRELPSCMMLDDRELANEWEGEDRRARADIAAARDAYLNYQRQHDPRLAAPNDAPLWFTFRVRGFHFFVMDTRTERTARSVANHASATIMGARQFRNLLRWLNRAPRDAVKFVAGPAMLVPRRLRASDGGSAACLHSSAWDGYPASMDALLGFLVRRRIPNVVFLSGDEHMSCDATLAISAGDATVQVRAIQSSPLYGPFPFTNTRPADLCDSGDRFGPRLPCPARREFRCEVTVHQVRTGDGYAIVTARPAGEGWNVAVRL